MKPKIYLLTILLLFTGLGATGLADSAWLHVEVDDNEDQININLPIILAEAVITLVDLSDEPTVIKIDEHEITVPEMREIWNILKEEGSFTLASIRSKEMEKGDNIDIAFRDNRLLITGSTDEDKIDINVSGDLIDALLSGEEDRLNLSACIQELKSKGSDSGYVHVISQDGDKVRLWVDNLKSTR